MVKKALAAAFCALLLTASTAGAWWTAPANDEWSPNDTYWDDHWLPDAATGNSYEFNGTDQYISVTDHDDFSFTDGSGTDAPFSTCIWTTLGDAESFIDPQIGKGPTSLREWGLDHDTNETVRFYTFDESSDKYIGRRTGVLASQGTWQHLCGTYDGAECAVNCDTSFNIYKDGVAIDATDYVNATYTGMENLGGEFRIGNFTNRYFVGNLAIALVTSDVMTAAEIASAGANTCANMVVDNVVACYDLSTDTVNDANPGTHDGTAEPSGGTPAAPASPADYPL